MYGFIGQRPAARHNSDAAFRVDMAGHDSNLAPARRNNAGTIRTNKPGASIAQIIEGADHIEGGDAFGNANNDRQACIRGFHDRVRRESWWNINHTGIGAGFFDGFGQRVEDRHTFVLGASFTGRYPGNDVRAVSNHLSGVKGALFAGDPLNDDASVLIDEYAQAVLPYQRWRNKQPRKTSNITRR